MKFDTPIALRLGEDIVEIGTPAEARDMLVEFWPPDARGPRHQDALDACLKVLDGDRSTADAETAFADAAVEAGLLAEPGQRAHRPFSEVRDTVLSGRVT
jgi:hypothetical protein